MKLAAVCYSVPPKATPFTGSKLCAVCVTAMVRLQKSSTSWGITQETLCRMQRSSGPLPSHFGRGVPSIRKETSAFGPVRNATKFSKQRLSAPIAGRYIRCTHEKSERERRSSYNASRLRGRQRQREDVAKPALSRGEQGLSQSS